MINCHNAAQILGVMAFAFGTATNASAGPLMNRQKDQLQADVAGGQYVTRDLADRAQAFDRAYRAAQGVDRAFDIVVGRVPAGRAVFRLGKKVGEEAYDAYARRR